MAQTLRADLYNPTLAASYATFSFVDNLGVIRKFARNTPDAPINLTSTGMLRAMGNFIDNPKFNPMTGLISRRDNTSTATATGVQLTTRNDVGVRLSFKAGPVVIAASAFKQGGWTEDQIAAEIGKQVGKQYALFLRKKFIGLIKTIVQAMTSSKHTYSEYVTAGAKANMTNQMLARARRVIGDAEWMSTDAANSGFIFRSECWNDLVAYCQGNPGTQVANDALAKGVAATMGIDYAIADDPSLYLAGSGTFDTFYALAIGSGLIECDIDKLEFAEPWYKGDMENPSWYFRADVDCSFHVPGFAYDKVGGGVNPNDSTLFNTTYWLPTYNDDREVKAILLAMNSSVS